MMQYMRDHAQGVIGWVLFIFVSIAFGLVGIQAYLGGDSKVVVATVDGVDIPLQSYQQAYSRERAFRQQLLGDRYDPAFLDEAVLKREAMKRIVDTEVLARSAHNAGLRIADGQLANQIRTFQQFQRDGQFDPGLYTIALNNQGLSEEAFEEGLRRDMMASQMVTAVMESELVTSHEIKQLMRLEEQQRRIGYMVLDADAYMETSEISDDQVSDYYEKHKARFSVPEKMQIEYLELSLEDMMSDIVVDEQALQSMYEEQAAEHSLPEERRASHILLQLDENAAEDVVAAARQKAEELTDRIRQGASFAALAKEHSDDPGSAQNGGDLDFFARGVMVKPFEDTVFSMEKGEVSDPVRSPFGYHIIRLTDIRASQRKPFSEVREALAREYRSMKAEEQFFEQADLLSDLTFEYPDSLETAAQELELEIKTSSFFERQRGDGIASDPRLREVAFSTDVLQAGNNSEALTLSDSHVVVLRKKVHQPRSYQDMETVRGQIVQSLREESAQERLNKLGEELLARLRNGESADKLAKEAGTVWKKTALVGRRDSDVPADVLQIAFRVPRSAVKNRQAASEGQALMPDGYALVSVLEIEDGKVTGDQSGLDMKRESILRSRSNHIGAALLESLKGQLEVKEYPDRI